MRTALALCLAVLTACGGDDPSGSGDPGTSSATVDVSSSAPVTPETTAPEPPAPETTAGVVEEVVSVEVANGTVELDGPAQAIVSLAPTATEMLFAVGAGDQVVAVDDQSDFPPEVPVTDLSGFTPNLEAIASYDPDLVVVTDDLDGIVAALEAVDIPVAHLPAAVDLDDTYHQIGVVGALTGHADDAEALVEEMRGEVEHILASVDTDRPPLTYYHELGPDLYTVTSETFIGQVYAMAGLASIADGTGVDAGPYPQLSVEYIIESDPDLIFLADAQCCDVTRESLAERPGWAGMRALVEGHVHSVDEDIASRWGPRVVDFLRMAADAAAAVDVGS